MITQVACPACQFKVSIPEADMGKRHVCSNCQSPFIAGASVSEPQAPRNYPAGAAPTYAKTMLAGTAPPINFNCPRCQAPQEALAIEAGTKKPCSACGQRLQIPAAPLPPAAPQPSLLNKTMLTTDDRMPPAPPIKYNCPNCKKPLESPASEAGIKKPCPGCGQRLQIPAASPARLQPNPNKTMLATDATSPQPFSGQPGYSTLTVPGAAASGPQIAPTTAPGKQITIGGYTTSVRNLVIGAAVVLFLLFIGQAVLRGGKAEDVAAAAAQKREIEKANEDFEQKKARVEDYNRVVAEMRAKAERQEYDSRQRYQEAIRGINDQRLRTELENKQTAEKDRLEQDKRESERQYQLKLAELKAEQDKAERTRQAAIAQPAPVVYYPPYHWRYYYGW